MERLLKSLVHKDSTETRVRFKMVLPDSILTLKDIFGQSDHKLFLVGGSVRDALLGIEPKDFDLATDALPDEVERMMARAGIRTLATGKSFGVINVFIDEDEFEIATFREDIGSSDSRRPDSVKFCDIATDVKRRDLTINALFFDIDTGEVVDLVGGLQDLKDKVIRTVGKPEERFGEDRLRILRAVRFAARFGSDLHPDVRRALLADASLEGISGERIRDEFLKGIKSSKEIRAFFSMLEEFDLFKWIFKGLKVSMTFTETKDPLLLMAFLLHMNEVSVLDKKLMALKFTIEEKRAVCFLVSLQTLSVDTAVKLKKSQKVAGVTATQVGAFGGKMRLHYNLLRAFAEFELTVSGEEVMKKLGMSPGKELGDTIHMLETKNFEDLL